MLAAVSLPVGAGGPGGVANLEIFGSNSILTFGAITTPTRPLSPLHPGSETARQYRARREPHRMTHPRAARRNPYTRAETDET